MMIMLIFSFVCSVDFAEPYDSEVRRNSFSLWHNFFFLFGTVFFLCGTVFIFVAQFFFLCGTVFYLCGTVFSFFVAQFFSSVRSSYSNPDLLLIHPPTFSDHSTLDFHFLSHYSYIKAIMLYKGKT